MQSVDSAMVREIILDAIKEINMTLVHKIPFPENGEVVSLYGKGAALDSFSLVSLLFTIENNIEDKLGRSISLSHEKAFSQKHSPFSTVDTLSDYIVKLVNE